MVVFTKSSRLNKLRAEFTDNNIDGLLVTQPENRRYLSGFDGTAGYLLITESKARLLTDFRYTEQAAQQAPDFEIVRIQGRLAEWFPPAVADLGIKKLGFEGDDVSFSLYQQFTAALSDVEMAPVREMVERLRAVKDGEEIACIEKAVAISDMAFNQVEKTINAGMTENQVAWELEKALRENGSEALPFEIIVASGPNAARPHHKPTDRTIQAGEPIVIDMGAKYQGYASDLSRTVCVGAPDATFLKVYEIVLDAQEVAEAIIEGGMTGHQADDAARKVISRAGYGHCFGHSLGHGVGLAAHELPHLSTNAEGILADGMVFTVEPGIYIPGWGGVRIEDTAVMESGKTRVMTQARKVSYD